MPIKKILLSVLYLFFIIGCRQEDEQASLLGIQSSLSETRWVLQYIESASREIQVPPEEFRETMYIYFDSDTTFRAGSPCNVGGGKYEANREGSIQVKVLGTTYMLCEDRRMEWENSFFDAIRKAEQYVIESDQMMLLGKNVMVFQRIMW